MAEKYSLFDPAELLDSDEAIEVFMAAAFETGDAKHIATALGIAARAKGMASLATNNGLSDEQLNSGLSLNSEPTLKTILAVMKEMGLALTSIPAPSVPQMP